MVNARRDTLGRAAALELARQASQLYVAKGRKTVHVNLKRDLPGDDELATLLLGPTGNLRAPTLRSGKTLIVGFNQEMYDQLFTG